ncbi:MAG: hypothetical protein M0038_15665 [Pseudomonadota bacterium]|nr:hypothetical protein [Pseudomonadota bacterium]
MTIANPGWMIIGRQIDTGFGGRADLLAIDAVGNLIILELKRDKTPREVIAQVLEYGAWVVKLTAAELAPIYRKYVERFHPERGAESLDEAFCRRFGTKELPEDLNQDHELIVVAAQLDATSERIVDYLASFHEVAINAIFFRVFKDADREYLARVWLRDPTEAAADPNTHSSEEWNGEYYVSFGGKRDWEEARRYGFISGGGGPFYSRTLSKLSPGDRIWVNVPGSGYVGVGEVTGKSEHIDDARIEQADGQKVPLKDIEGLKIGQSTHAHDRGEMGEYIVPVKWIKTVPLAQAVKERGLFGNQNTVAQPRAERWRHTVERLRVRFGIRE